MTGRFKIALFFIILVFPGLTAAVTARVAITRAESLEFCSSCHTMTPWVENVTGADSDSLASEHFRNKWIQHDQCYTCHTNYGLFGPVEAKIKGVRHVIAYYTGVPDHIELYDPFPNENCLHCHLDAKGFREDSNHDPMEDILSGKDSCIDCHENLHGVEQASDKEASAEEAADDAAEGAAKPEDAGKPEDAAKDEGDGDKDKGADDGDKGGDDDAK